MKHLLTLLICIALVSPADAAWVIFYSPNSTPVPNQVRSIKGPVSPEKYTGVAGTMVFNRARPPQFWRDLDAAKVPIRFRQARPAQTNVVEMRAAQKQQIRAAVAAAKAAGEAARVLEIQAEATNILYFSTNVIGDSQVMAMQALAAAFAEALEAVRTEPLTPPITTSNLLWSARNKITLGEIQ